MDEDAGPLLSGEASPDAGRPGADCSNEGGRDAVPVGDVLVGEPPAGGTGSGTLAAMGVGPRTTTPTVSATDTSAAPNRTSNVARRTGASNRIVAPLVTGWFGAAAAQACRYLPAIP